MKQHKKKDKKRVIMNMTVAERVKKSHVNDEAKKTQKMRARGKKTMERKATQDEKENGKKKEQE